MHGIYGLIDIGISTFRASQTALMATGDNISNANNPDFTRRRVVFQEKPPILSLPILIGRGAEVIKISRVYDSFLGQRWLQEEMNMGYHNVKKYGLSRIDTIFNDTQGGGLSEALDAFWEAWEEVSTDPTNIVSRQNLLYKTQSLCDTFHKMSKDLKEIQTDMDTEIENAVIRINDLAKQIAYLNEQVQAIEIKGVEANNFRDRRDALIRELGQLANITTFETKEGVTVLIDGAPLVEGKNAYSLELKAETDGHYGINWVGEDGTKIDITNRINNGKIGAYLEIRDEVVPQYLNELDKLAFQLVKQINTIHYGNDYGNSDAYDLNSDNERFFFVLNNHLDDPLLKTTTGIAGAATHIDLAPEEWTVSGTTYYGIDSHPERIAAASAPEEPSNNEKALEILNLKKTSLSELNNATFNDFYHSLIGKVGTETDEAKANYDHQKMVLDETKKDFDTVSGVSLDEESANLIRFQQMYNASAKLINIADEMMKTLINLGA